MNRCDRQDAFRKQMKAIMWPEMDSDGLASSYTLKVLQTLGKWSMRMQTLMEVMDTCRSDHVVELPG